ncbi:bifunctional diguanylate cyclase/phosphodiesterase [Neptuniibacter sp. 1_MG-2023]|uniref:putative bifunctional diguanylate cyclase/phosphodiesterase n=1 Tax=Neptuniibacter sp. 1_MG-2023 TaxID=3062662 RepID=UPI0026E30669|nr:EAL domain-containing protein [Neptuniibacter sp. 1_MG-2023]MDO6595171.1 EAL domain-containing protein [Neptuniibacter sp. 1_MG-2023]
MFRQALQFLTQRSLAFSVFVFVIVFLIATFFVNHEFERIRDNQKHQAFVNLLTLGARLEGAINSHLVVLRGLKAEIAINSDITQSEFARLVDEYLQTQLSISHIALAPDLIITNIYPVLGNESALGVDYRDVPDQFVTVQESVINNQVILTGPVDLVQGGSALIARVPVFIGVKRDILWGLISVVINDKELFANAGLHEKLWGLDIAIRGKDGKGSEGAVFFGHASTFDNDPVIVDVFLPLGKWQLAASAKGGWQVSLQEIIYFWAAALLVSLVTAMATYLIASNYREKLVAIDTANYRASYDGLTGLSNRYHFTQRFKKIINEHQRHGNIFALFFIDLDYFKEVNDNWGHHAGDELLRLFSQRMGHIVRSDDLIARLAGDEFVIVLNDIETATQAELLAEKLQLELGEPYLIGGQYLSVTHSLGIAIYPQDGQSADVLLQNADRAMYEAKRSGKNRIYFFNDELSLEVKRHVQVHNEILDGIRRGQFQLYLQPIMSLKDRKISKCEALIRWFHPERGVVSPVDFIPIAEQTGAIRALGDWVLEEACHLSNQLTERGIDVQIAVNRSVAEFFPKDAVERWLNIIDQYEVDHHKLVFEITESLLMDGGGSQLDKINQLREQGIAFAIDDFGTGYSAINYLRHYPVDFLKIDRSFVTDIMDDVQDRTLVEVIIKMGQTLGIRVVAEGVETKEQLAMLDEYGCDFIQGFYLGKPLPFDEFIAFYRSR